MHLVFEQSLTYLFWNFDVLSKICCKSLYISTVNKKNKFRISKFYDFWKFVWILNFFGKETSKKDAPDVYTSDFVGNNIHQQNILIFHNKVFSWFLLNVPLMVGQNNHWNPRFLKIPALSTVMGKMMMQSNLLWQGISWSTPSSGLFSPNSKISIKNIFCTQFSYQPSHQPNNIL